jgi:tRNA pseudouridine38-40 synthase
MPRIKLTIEYEGTRYKGWQQQKNGTTIQGELERAFEIIFKEQIKIIASGRTDSGVHAHNQIAHCDIPVFDENLPGVKLELQKIKRSVNGIIQKDIVVKNIELCQPDFHARFDAKSRIYKYYITQTAIAVNRQFSWLINVPLNFTLMQKAARDLIHITDFESFCKVGSNNKTFTCTIHESKFFYSSNLWVYEIEANRFLYGMVRAIVGTLVLLGQGKITYKQYQELINSKSKNVVNYLAPATGLFLEEIKY